MSTRKLVGCSLLLMAMFTLPVLAQPAPGDGGGPGGGQGGPGGPPDPAEMRQRFSDRMKEMLGATDAEWKALQPAVDKVRQLQRDAGGRGPGMGGPGGPGGRGGPDGGGPGGFGGPGARGGPDGGGGGPQDQGDRPRGPDQDQPQSDVQQKLSDLRSALQDKDTSADQIKSKLAALRDARTKAKADLVKAQNNLRDMLTVRQEATMVMMNVLE